MCSLLGTFKEEGGTGKVICRWTSMYAVVELVSPTVLVTFATPDIDNLSLFLSTRDVNVRIEDNHAHGASWDRAWEVGCSLLVVEVEEVFLNSYSS